MKTGEWLKPPGQLVQHFILKPLNPEWVWRHSSCERVFLFGTGTYKSKAKRCVKCEGTARQEEAGR